MINLEKCQPPPFKKTCPCYFHPLSSQVFQVSPPLGEVYQDLLPPLYKRGGGGVRTMIKQVRFVKSSRFDGFVLALFCIIDTGESLILENFRICWLVVFSTNIFEQINFWLQLGSVSFTFLDSFCNFWSFSNHDVNIKSVTLKAPDLMVLCYL